MDTLEHNTDPITVKREPGRWTYTLNMPGVDDGVLNQVTGLLLTIQPEHGTVIHDAQILGPKRVFLTLTEAGRGDEEVIDKQVSVLVNHVLLESREKN